jgi:hypothetical protein
MPLSSDLEALQCESGAVRWISTQVRESVSGFCYPNSDFLLANYSNWCLAVLEGMVFSAWTF